MTPDPSGTAPLILDPPIPADRCAHCWAPLPLRSAQDAHRCLSLREALWPGNPKVYSYLILERR